MQKNLEQQKDNEEQQADDICGLSDDLSKIDFGFTDNKCDTEENSFKKSIANNDHEMEYKPNKINDNSDQLSAGQKVSVCSPKKVLRQKKRRESYEEEVMAEDIKNLKVAGPRSRKPTLARVWRKQKEKQKMDIKNEILPCL